MNKLPIRLGLQQRVLAPYRIPFFDELAGICQKGLSVFAGKSKPGEMIHDDRQLSVADYSHGKNVEILKGKFTLCWQMGWQNWLNTWDPDVLILEANARYLHVPLMAQWMHQRGRPVIGWGLGAPNPPGENMLLRKKFRRLLIKNFDAMITYSSKGAKEYQHLGFNPDHIFSAPNAVSPRPSWPLPIREIESTHKPIVLFVGRLQSRKRVDLLIRACAALPPELTPVLWIVGDGPELSRLKELAHSILPETRFFDSLFGDALAAVFRQADLFVLPGTGGLAVQEAMSYGLPVIVAEADGTQEDLVHPENGWLIPSGDLNVLVETLKDALRDLNRLRRMGEHSYDIVSREINLEAMVEIFRSAIIKCKQADHENSPGS